MRRYPPPLIHPPRGTLPVLLSVPHSGHEHDRDTLANARQGLRSLEPLVDPLVDRLAWRAIASGIGAVVQRVPRAVIDCNRDESEVDPASVEGISPAPVGPRARHGLGLIPSRTSRHGGLWRHPISRDELERRIGEVHRPYHAAIESGLDRIAIDHGRALLLDCHSMPSRAGQADVVIGNRHGQTADADLAEAAARIARAGGFTVALNDPYAGGAIVERHGRAGTSVQALQLEIGRALYLEPDMKSPSRGFDRVARLVVALAEGLAAHDWSPWREAAE
jgi:N-formylglutamate amidohydrolase